MNVSARTGQLAKPGWLKIVGYTAGALLVLLVILVLTLPLLLNSSFVKQHLQARIAVALELEAGLDGRLQLDYFPGLQFILNDLRFERAGTVVATIEQLRIGVAFWPLLRREVRISSIDVREPVILLERFEDGSYNIRKPDPRVTLMLSRVAIANATFRYDDALLGTSYAASACNLDLQGTRPLTRDSRNHLADLDLGASFVCAELRKDGLVLTDARVSARAQAGVLQLEPVSMQLFGAPGSGQLRADFTGAVPMYQLDFALPQFHVDELFRLLTPKREPEGMLVEGALVEGALVEGALVEGLMDFSASLSMQGQTLLELKQTLAGAFTLHGENLVINGADLDERLARFEASQNFNLVDVGAFLFAGPLGLVLTKGYNFANIFLESGTRSEIPAVVSDWIVEAGVAQAQVVMMTTLENRIALKGGLDIPGETFNSVTIALLDDAGCARVEQSIQGTFQNPVIEQPTVLRSLAGPVRTLIEKLLPGEECELFY